MMHSRDFVQNHRQTTGNPTIQGSASPRATCSALPVPYGVSMPLQCIEEQQGPAEQPGSLAGTPRLQLRPILQILGANGLRPVNSQRRIECGNAPMAMVSWGHGVRRSSDHWVASSAGILESRCVSGGCRILTRLQ